MPELGDSSPPITVRSEGAAVSLGTIGWQQIILGGSQPDRSPLLLGITHIVAGERSELIKHATSEVCFVLSGNGHMVGDKAVYRFTAGDALLIEPESWHAIQADPAGDVEMLFCFPQRHIPLTHGWEALS
ncbi:cupin domain-containing protein [Leifsonia sp. NPDC056665]|uniref:cupin domain-containing protein n=1 Tax=Leifsonia sp. NPDC056665 TaxID=3345901 RepID=UPI0036AF109F